MRQFHTKEVRARGANGAAFLYSLTVSSKSSKTYPGVKNGERIANEPSITAAPNMCVNLGQQRENDSIQGSKYVANDRIRNEQQHRVTASDLWNGLSMGFKGCSIRAEMKNDRWINKKPMGSTRLAQTGHHNCRVLTKWSEARQSPLLEPASRSREFQFVNRWVIFRGNVYGAENQVQSKSLRVCYRFRSAASLKQRPRGFLRHRIPTGCN